MNTINKISTPCLENLATHFSSEDIEYFFNYLKLHDCENIDYDNLNINCDNCNECSNCYNCSNCSNCEKCIDCYNCSNCIHCCKCDNCYNCDKCINSDNLENNINCINCVDCGYSENLKLCENVWCSSELINCSNGYDKECAKNENFKQFFTIKAVKDYGPKMYWIGPQKDEIDKELSKLIEKDELIASGEYKN